MQALACYVRDERPEIPSSVRSYIESNLRHLDYSHTLNTEKLYSQGTHSQPKIIFNSELRRKIF